MQNPSSTAKQLTFYKLEKHLSFRQQLNSFAKIGDKSKLMFLRTITGTLSRLVSLLRIKAFDKPGNFLCHYRDITNFVLHEKRKVRKSIIK